jgi:hypothetical protein
MLVSAEFLPAFLKHHTISGDKYLSPVISVIFWNRPVAWNNRLVILGLYQNFLEEN